MNYLKKLITLVSIFLMTVVIVSSEVFEARSASNIEEDQAIFGREKKLSDLPKIESESSGILSNTEFGSSSELLEFTKYNNTAYNYSFRYPSIWKVDNLPNNLFPYLRIENFDSNEIQSRKNMGYEQYFKIEVVILPNNKNHTLSGWIDELVTTSYPLPQIVEQRDIQIAGLPAIYQLERVGSFIHPVVYTQKAGEIYLINISSDAEKFESIIDNFLNSFSFEL